MKDRTKNVKINILVGFFCKALLLMVVFVSRTMFIRLLGAEYVGISSLYSNILGFLSLADLGMLNVLSYELYYALKDNNRTMICSLVEEFKKIYVKIGFAVLIIGILLIPFLPLIVNSRLDDRELVVYYLLYLVNSVASYFVVYRTTVISADQKTYITNIVQMSLQIIMNILQVLYLLLTVNFLGYLIIQVLCTITSNVVLHCIATRLYPFLDDESLVNYTLINKNKIFTNIKATFLSKISNTILGQSDTIIISVMFGTAMVGYYSNYNTLNIYVCSIMSIILDGMVATLGNFVAMNTKLESYGMFKNILFGFSIITTFTSVCLLCLVQDFVPMWIGNEYLMGMDMVLAIVLVFYQGNSMNAVTMFRSTLGIFKEIQYMYLVCAVINIILSILLGRYLGVSGIIFATAISRMITVFWYDGLVVMKKLEKRGRDYFIIQGKEYLTSIIIMMLTYVICSYISLGGYINLLIKVVICSITTFSIEWAVHRHTDEWKWLQNKVLGKFKLSERKK